MEQRQSLTVLGEALFEKEPKEAALAERDGLWRALPSEVAEWWRLRDEGAAPAERLSQGFVKPGETPTETLFEPPVPRAERAPVPS